MYLQGPRGLPGTKGDDGLTGPQGLPGTAGHIGGAGPKGHMVGILNTDTTMSVVALGMACYIPQATQSAKRKTIFYLINTCKLIQ